MPTSVKQALKAAEANGWSTRITYAVGPAPEEVHSVVFRARRGDVVFAAAWSWLDGDKVGIDFVYRTTHLSPSVVRFPFEKVGFREMTAELKTPRS